MRQTTFNKNFTKIVSAFCLLSLCVYGPSVLAATTIGLDITTNGNLTADGNIKFASGAATGNVLQSIDNAGNADWATLTFSDVGLGSVEKKALSTWAGSTNITTLGTVTTAAVNVSLWTNDAGYISRN